MKDLAHEQTDKQIKELDRQIRDVYSEASRDLQKKLDKFNEDYKFKEAVHLQEVKDGIWTQEQFDNWKRGQVFQGNQWKAKQDQIVRTLTESNQIAADIINGQTQNVFAFNATYMNYILEHGAGVDFGFGVYDNATVARLLKDDPQMLPKWKIDEPKDYIWNQKQVNNAVSQGIIQGESLNEISKRIYNGLVMRNENLSKTFARTSMTGAQNAGRQTSLKEAEKIGIQVNKQWMATLDNHTRDSHADLDGESVPTDQPFSNGLMYPGDPTGEPREVYNCRCTMVGDLKKYPAKYERYDNIDGKPIAGMTYKQWLEAKTTGKNTNQFGRVIGSTFKIKTNYGTTWLKVGRERSVNFTNGDNGTYYTKDADTFTADDGFKIVYPYDLDTSKQNLTVEQVVKARQTIPKDIINVIQNEVHIVDYANPEDDYWRQQYKDFTSSYAVGGVKVTFFASTYHDDGYLIDTLVHEGGHYLDKYLEGTQYDPFSERGDWMDATKNDLQLIGFDSPTPYGKNSMQEDFAESLMMFVKDHSMMERQFPNRTAVLAKLLNKYK